MKLSDLQPYVIPLLRVLVGAIMLIAGISKLFPLEGFYAQMLAYNMPLPAGLLKLAAVPLIAFEIWLGLSLLLHSNLQLALRGTQILLFFMIPITIWGTFNQAPSCGCYGTLWKREPWMATIEDALLLVLCAVLYPQYKQARNTHSIAVEVFIGLLTLGSLGYAIWQYVQLLSAN